MWWWTCPLRFVLGLEQRVVFLRIFSWLFLLRLTVAWGCMALGVRTQVPLLDGGLADGVSDTRGLLFFRRRRQTVWRGEMLGIDVQLPSDARDVGTVLSDRSRGPRWRLVRR